MPTAADLHKVLQELHTKKLIDLDASLRSLLEVEGLSVLDHSEGGTRPLWNAVAGSGYCIVTRD
jgi:hypothetical protein